MSKGWNWLGEVVFKHKTLGGVEHRYIRPPFAGEKWPWPDRFFWGSLIATVAGLTALLCWYEIFDSRWVSTVGLLLDIVGVGLLAWEIFVRPDPSPEQYRLLKQILEYFHTQQQGLRLSAPRVDQEEQLREDTARHRANRWRGFAGLVMAGFGFLLQICATWHPQVP
ncbi:MAG: hypothetical protein HY423_04705 [Candidatus Lambdaproteobacteria bacterium]|nr:hypothetical protein [Candidatus Lambdaproteobacteria bacterium]